MYEYIAYLFTKGDHFQCHLHYYYLKLYYCEIGSISSVMIIVLRDYNFYIISTALYQIWRADDEHPNKLSKCQSRRYFILKKTVNRISMRLVFLAK